jgi:hypothetical protein
MCPDCAKSGKHPKEHRMLRIDTPEDAQNMALDYEFDFVGSHIPATLAETPIRADAYICRAILRTK